MSKGYNVIDIIRHYNASTGVTMSDIIGHYKASLGVRPWRQPQRLKMSKTRLQYPYEPIAPATMHSNVARPQCIQMSTVSHFTARNVHFAARNVVVAQSTSQRLSTAAAVDSSCRQRLLSTAAAVYSSRCPEHLTAAVYRRSQRLSTHITDSRPHSRSTATPHSGCLQQPPCCRACPRRGSDTGGPPSSIRRRSRAEAGLQASLRCAAPPALSSVNSN